MSKLRLLAFATVACLVLSTGACGGKNSTTTTTTSSTSSSTTAPTTGTSAATQDPSAVSIPPSGQTSHLTDVEITSTANQTDRVTFTFDRGAPGYRIEYVDPAGIKGTNGKQISIDGTAATKVTFAMASAVDISSGGKPSYPGANRIAPTVTTSVKELALIEDYEGYLSWAIGTTGKVAFTVSTGTNPSQVSIDFKH